MDRPSAEPGSRILGMGVGCPEGSSVSVFLGQQPLSTTTADASGKFVVPAKLPGNISVGRHVVTSNCGALSLRSVINVVVTTQALAPATALGSLTVFTGFVAYLVFFQLRPAPAPVSTKQLA